MQFALKVLIVSFYVVTSDTVYKQALKFSVLRIPLYIISGITTAAHKIKNNTKLVKKSTK